jgi:hypothetical protein
MLFLLFRRDDAQRSGRHSRSIRDSNADDQFGRFAAAPKNKTPGAASAPGVLRDEMNSSAP